MLDNVFNKENEQKLEMAYNFSKALWWSVLKKGLSLVLSLGVSGVLFVLVVQGYFVIYDSFGFQKTVIVFMAGLTVIIARYLPMVVSNANSKNT